MKASKFSDAQKAFILKQAEEGAPVGEVCRKAGISEATFYSEPLARHWFERDGERARSMRGCWRRR